ncbi:ATP-binding protein [Bifidobacterium sp.]|uniref:ATP-binding protein n=1 Tax=Bifidobacterium sp. TaxID=41200 RepID=UPI003D7DE493
MNLFTGPNFVLELLIAAIPLLWNCPRKSRFPLRLTISLFAYLAIGFLISTQKFNGWADLLRFLAIFIVLIVGIRICLDIRDREVLFRGVAAYALQYCCESIVYLANIPLNRQPLTEPLIMFVEYPIVAIPASLLMAWSFRRNQDEHIADTSLFAISSTILAVTMIISFAQWMYLPLGNKPTRVICLVYAILCSALSLAIQSGLLVQSHWRHEAEFMERMWRLDRQHYELSQDAIDLINVKSHDLRKQIDMLRSSAATMPTGQALDALEESVEDYDMVAHTGNAALDVILTDKIMAAHRIGASLSYLVDGKAFLGIDSIDLYSIFGNILDNAIEAVEPLRQPLRVIDLKACKNNEFLIIRCDNYCDPRNHVSEGSPIETTKPDKAWHGFGLKSIQMTANKLGGSVTFDVNDDMFTINVMIPT